MITWALVALIFVVGLFHKTDKFPICLFAVMTSMTLAIEANTPADFNYYYLISATINLMLIMTLSRINNLTSTILAIQAIAYALIYLDLFGFIAYEMYISSTYYTQSCNLMFVLMLLMTASGERNLNVIRLNNKLRSNASGFRRYHSNSSLQLQSSKAQART